MSNIIYCDDQDFYLSKGQSGKVLLSNSKHKEGIFFVFFFSTKCPNCDVGMEAFTRLIRKFPPEVKFGAININDYPTIIAKAAQSCTPLEYVPYLVLYFRGKPFLRYDGEMNTEDMTAFLTDSIKRIDQKKEFVKTNSKEEMVVPEYAGGIPYNIVCNKNKCYIKYNDVYNKK
jgi:thiol-disulfide isomerase/thioredoxin